MLTIVLGVLLHAIWAAGGFLPKTPRFQHTMEIFDGQMCVFGGKSVSTSVNIDDFLLDYRCVDVTKTVEQAQPKWKLQNSASQFAMPPLAQHTTVYDRVNHVIVPFGGQSPNGFSKAINLAVYCSMFQAWGASNVLDRDIRRYVHTSVLQDKTGDMIIFGGASDPTTADGQDLNAGNGERWFDVNRLVLDDARHNAYNTSSNATLGSILKDDGQGTPDVIRGVIHHSSVLLNDTLMVVLGGDVYVNESAVMQPFDLLHIYNVDTMKWHTQECTGDIPPLRCAFSASQHERHIYMFGGVNVNDWSTFFNDLYELDTLTWTWRKMPTPNAPSPRYAHQMKTLGKYLIVTHGFIYYEDGTNGGDEDIYFYDLQKETFVTRYSPSGISKRELDTEWRVQRTGATDAVSAVCLLLVVLVALIAVYYMLSMLFTRSRPRPRRQSRGEGILSFVESYTETFRPSTHHARASQDTAMFATETKLAGLNARSHSMSEGTTTIIENEQQTNALRESKRHARILDEDAATPYVSRKLTLSARIPTYSSHSDDDSLDEIRSPLAITN
ncbi:hypothetical protein H4S00_000269 [Coemansia sp. D1744]|nr:hypothetical protein H4S00_000269 [Coemansia sp. D1744]